MIPWAVLLLLAFRAHSGMPPSAQTIVQRSVEANKLDWEMSPKYEFDETDFQPGGHTLTYHVTMIQGSPYQELISVDGKPLSPKQRTEEHRKLQQTVQTRRGETAEEHARRVENYQKERARDHLLMNQLAIAFNFKLIGEQKLGPYKVYVLKATRRPGYSPPTREAEVLTGMEGRLWIDEQTFQWVKVEAHVIQPVSIVGFLATVEPGTRFELEQAPVSNGVWLKKHFSMRARAKILFFFSHNEQEQESYFNYRLQDAQHE